MLPDITIGIKLRTNLHDWPQDLSNSCDGIWSNICTQILYCCLHSSVEMLKVQVTRDVAARLAVGVDKLTPNKLLGQLWR